MLDKDRIESILEILLQYTVKDFENSIPISNEGDEIDAIAVGVNTMGEELNLTLNEIQQTNENLLKKNKELEQFSYIASHDLQEPLLTIRNYTQLFEEDYSNSLDDNGKLYLKFISEAAHRMSFLVKGLLDYSNIGNHAEIESVDTQEIVTDVLQDFKEEINAAKAQISCQDLPNIMAYKKDFSLLIKNLIGNALKYAKSEVNAIIDIGCKENNQHWEFYVRDNGIGIPESQFERIFIIFQRLHNKKEYHGTGIGLAHCRKIAELHQGKIWVESAIGIGSTFHFTLKK